MCFPVDRSFAPTLVIFIQKHFLQLSSPLYYTHTIPSKITHDELFVSHKLEHCSINILLNEQKQLFDLCPHTHQIVKACWRWWDAVRVRCTISSPPTIFWTSVFAKTFDGKALSACVDWRKFPISTSGAVRYILRGKIFFDISVLILTSRC